MKEFKKIPWSGNLGHWYYNISTGFVLFNPLKVEVLGYTMDELPKEVHYKFFVEKLHPDDYGPTMAAMKRNMIGEMPIYECEYRIMAKDGTYKWFYDWGKVVKRDAHGKPLFVAGIVFDITERKSRLENLEMENLLLAAESMTDALTRIRNRGAIIGELTNRLEQSTLYGSPISICMFDIDRFKTINDTKGHVFGDEILRTIAKLMSDEIRGLDTVGRYGGEEFLVILPNTHINAAQHVVERIRSSIENHLFEEDLKVTISGGIAQYQGEELMDFIDVADKNLYAAKKNGRNQITA